MLARVNKLVWGFVWGSRCETVSRNTLSLSPCDGGLGESNFILKYYALLLSIVISTFICPDDPSFYLRRYFIGSRLASTRAEWAHLRNMSVPNASSPTPFYVFALRVLSDVPDLSDFSSKRIYLRLLSDLSSLPSLPVQWSRFVSPTFSIKRHCSVVRDDFCENFKNDLS